MISMHIQCGEWSDILEIDESIFDDVYLEGCTRAIEEKMKNGGTTVTPYMLCNEINKKKSKLEEKTHIYNTYKILINASYYKKAALLRKILLENTSIDLDKEPIKAKD